MTEYQFWMTWVGVPLITTFLFCAPVVLYGLYEEMRRK